MGDPAVSSDLIVTDMVGCVLWPQTGRLVFVAESWLNPPVVFFGPFGGPVEPGTVQ